MKTIEDFDLEVCKMKEADTYIDMIIENCNEEQIQHIILGLDQHIANKTWKAMTKTVEFTQKFFSWRKDKSDF